MSDPFLLQKRHVQRAFDRAAHSYEAAAALQHEVGQRMLERLSLFRVTPEMVVDAGSGTGSAAVALSKRFRRARIVELDLAYAMLQKSRCREPRWQRIFSVSKRRSHVCADVEHMPLRSQSVDLVWSNLCFQWSTDLGCALGEVRRVLKPNGLLTFTTFGPDTLRELREAFSVGDSAVHVNRFVDMHDIGDLLVQCGFADPVMDMEYFTLTYAALRDLMQELKSIGAHNVNEGRQRGLMGRNAWFRSLAHYERLRDADGRLPATFEVVYGHAFKPAPRTSPSGRPVIDVRIAGRD